MTKEEKRVFNTKLMKSVEAGTTRQVRLIEETPQELREQAHEIAQQSAPA
jgi:hypothetical protein